MPRVIEQDDGPALDIRPEDRSEVVELIEELSGNVTTLCELVRTLAGKQPQPPSVQPILTAIAAQSKAITDKLDSLKRKPEWEFKFQRDPYGFLESIRAKEV